MRLIYLEVSPNQIWEREGREQTHPENEQNCHQTTAHRTLRRLLSIWEPHAWFNGTNWPQCHKTNSNMTTVSLHLYTSSISSLRTCLTAWREGWTSPGQALSPTISSPATKAHAAIARPGDSRWTRQARNGAQKNEVQGIIHTHGKSTIKVQYCKLLLERAIQHYTTVYSSTFLLPLGISWYPSVSTSKATLKVNLNAYRFQFIIDANAPFAKDVKLNYPSASPWRTWN